MIPIVLSRLTLILLLLGLMSGCGFKLRGSNDQTLGNALPEIYLEGVKTDLGFGSELVRVLAADGVEVLPKGFRQLPELSIDPVKKQRQVLSVDADIRAREYALISELKFALKQPGELEVPKKQVIRVRRDLVVDPNQVLGSDQEETRLRRDMERELAQLVVLRLRLQ